MIQFIELKLINDNQHEKVVKNLSAALAMIGEALDALPRDGTCYPLVAYLTNAGKSCAIVRSILMAAQPEKPKEKTMATSTPKKTTTKKASKPLAKGLKAVKAMKPAKKVAK